MPSGELRGPAALLACGGESRPFPMFGLALKMLFGDTAKYLMLVAGLFFATSDVCNSGSNACTGCRKFKGLLDDAWRTR